MDPAALVKDFGYIGIFTALFLESGIPFGFFLPGDSLLFTAGLLASQNFLNLEALIILSVAAAVLGNNAGYYTGLRFGRRLFKNEKSFWFSPQRLDEAGQFFKKEGPISLVLARFIPAGRTFVPIAAGAARMRYQTFLIFNAVGGLLWGIMLPVLGFTLGKTIPNIDKYLLPAIAVIIVLSVLPAAWHRYRQLKKKN